MKFRTIVKQKQISSELEKIEKEYAEFINQNAKDLVDTVSAMMDEKQVIKGKASKLPLSISDKKYAQVFTLLEDIASQFENEDNKNLLIDAINDARNAADDATRRDAVKQVCDFIARDFQPTVSGKTAKDFVDKVENGLAEVNRDFVLSDKVWVGKNRFVNNSNEFDRTKARVEGLIDIANKGSLAFSGTTGIKDEMASAETNFESANNYLATPHNSRVIDRIHKVATYVAASALTVALVATLIGNGSLKKQNAELSNNYARAEATIEEKDQTIENQKTELNAKADYDTIKAAYEALLNAPTSGVSQDTVDELNAQITQLTSDLASAQTEVKELENKISALQGSIDILNAQLANAGADPDLLKTIETLETEKAGLESQLADLQSKYDTDIAAANAATKKAEDEAKAAKDAATKAEKEASEAKATVASLQSQVSTLKTEKANIQKELDAAKKTSSANAAKVSELESKLADVEKELADAEQTLADAEIICQSLRNVIGNVMGEDLSDMSNDEILDMFDEMFGGSFEVLEKASEESSNTGKRSSSSSSTTSTTETSEEEAQELGADGASNKSKR